MPNVRLFCDMCGKEICYYRYNCYAGHVLCDECLSKLHKKVEEIVSKSLDRHKKFSNM